MKQFLDTITSFALTAICLATSTGVFMHDMRVDKAVSVAFAPAPVAVVSTKYSVRTKMVDFTNADSHTHPDFKPAKSLMSGFAYQVPPRNRLHSRRHAAKLTEPVGRHAFDDHLMPVLAA